MAAKKKLKVGDPERKAKLTKVYDTLKKVRTSTTVKLKPSAFLRDKTIGIDGEEVDFKLRYYQVQGAFHLLMLKRMVLGDDTGLGKCCVGDTQLLTDRGLLPIQALAPEGELEADTFYPPRLPVRVWTGEHWASVRRFYWNGEAQTLKVTTRRGYTLEGSRQHPLLVLDTKTGVEDFVKTSDLDPAKHWVCLDRSQDKFPKEEPILPELGNFSPNTLIYSSPEQLTPDLSRLLAYVVAESWCNCHDVVVITQHRSINPEVHDDIRGLLKSVYGWEGNLESATKDISICVSSVFIREHLRLCGVEKSVAQGKKIPWVVQQGTKESVRAFLSGLLDAEGSVCSDGGFEYSSASEDLARGVHLQLLRFGVMSTLSKKKVKGRHHTYWRVVFCGDDARRFLDRIGLVSTRKIVALREALDRPSNPNKNVVPLRSLGEQIREALLAGTSKCGSNTNRSGSGLKQFGSSLVNTLNNTRNFGRSLSYDFLRKTLPLLEEYAPASQAYQEVKQLLARDRYYDPISTIIEGRSDVMDIEVDHPRHSFVGNGFINHNTIEAISATCHLLERNPDAKVIIVTPKSTVHQWASEFQRFTQGIRTIVVETKPTTKDGRSPLEQRKALYREWVESKTPAVLLVNYAILVRDWDAEGFVPVKENGKPDPKKPVVPGVLDQATRDAGPSIITFFDEAQAFKHMRTKTWEKCHFLSERSDRCYGLTATLLGSELLEGFCIYKCIKPELFETKTKFLETYCYTELKSIPGSRAKMPVILGYKNLDHFRAKIDPFFLGRKKQEVSNELPVLISKDIECELSDAENRKYGEALSGVLELGDGDVKDFEEHKALVALLYCQQVADSLALLKYKEGDAIGEEFDYEELDYKDIKIGALGAKEEAIVDLIAEDGELAGEKVIIYTRFAKFVPRLQKILAKAKVKSVCITGQSSLNKAALEEVGIKGVKAADARKAAQEVFQDPKSDVKVMIITNAGGVGINLQMAKALIFYNLPWTWGDYVQTLGRMIRIGSPHRGVAVYHLFALRPSLEGDTKTIDHHVYALLRKKQKLIDAVLGEAAAGALDFDKGPSGAMDLLRAMQEAQSAGEKRVRN